MPQVSVANELFQNVQTLPAFMYVLVPPAGSRQPLRVTPNDFQFRAVVGHCVPPSYSVLNELAKSSKYPARHLGLGKVLDSSCLHPVRRSHFGVHVAQFGKSLLKAHPEMQCFLDHAFQWPFANSTGPRVHTSLEAL